MTKAIQIIGPNSHSMTSSISERMEGNKVLLGEITSYRFYGMIDKSLSNFSPLYCCRIDDGGGAQIEFLVISGKKKKKRKKIKETVISLNPRGMM